MRRFLPAFLLTLALSGCLYQPDVGDQSDVVPVPSGDVLEVAAEKSVRDYAAGLSAVAREAASKAGEFKSHSDVYDFAAKANAEARGKAFQELAEAMDKSVDPESEYDADKVQKAFEGQAVGFERIAKGK